MKHIRLSSIIALLIFVGCQKMGDAGSEQLRFMTYNLEDVRTDDLLRKDHPRLRAAARVIQRLRPDIMLLNEIAYDQPGVPGFEDGAAPGQNGQRFADSFLAVSQGMGFRPLHYRSFMAPSNTGQRSGYDLDHDGIAVIIYPSPPSAGEDGSPAPQTVEGRMYGNDNWGFGTFPGQYAMALLVREDLQILQPHVRTFQHFLWKDLPNAGRPIDPETGKFWYDDDVWAQFPLSSKSHWDVPVRLPNGAVLHVLVSHPTPAAFDGPEKRNKMRNRDEIRFWNDYISGAEYIYDDKGLEGGLQAGSSFVIMGDLNADPNEGSAIDDPIGTFLFAHPSINGDYVPRADSMGARNYPDLDNDDTALWGMRVDYVLPSMDLTILGGAIVRPSVDPAGNRADDLSNHVSDHFPVIMDLMISNQ